LHEARKVLAQLQHAAEVVRGVAQGLQGRLDIGITGSMVYRQVPGFCRAFRAERPLVELCLHEMSTRDQLQAIARGQIDCGFLNIGTPQDDIRTLSIGEEAFVCCLPSDHALARRAKSTCANWPRTLLSCLRARWRRPTTTTSSPVCSRPASIPIHGMPRASG
jgi:DNA-binding transcriptional LysR family regulator